MARPPGDSANRAQSRRHRRHPAADPGRGPAAVREHPAPARALLPGDRPSALRRASSARTSDHVAIAVGRRRRPRTRSSGSPGSGSRCAPWSTTPTCSASPADARPGPCGASWMIGSAFAALSGVLLAPAVGLDASILTFLVVQAFGAAAHRPLHQHPAHLPRRPRHRRRRGRLSTKYVIDDLVPRRAADLTERAVHRAVRRPARAPADGAFAEPASADHRATAATRCTLRLGAVARSSSPSVVLLAWSRSCSRRSSRLHVGAVFSHDLSRRSGCSSDCPARSRCATSAFAAIGAATFCAPDAERRAAVARWRAGAALGRGAGRRARGDPGDPAVRALPRPRHVRLRRAGGADCLLAGLMFGTFAGAGPRAAASFGLDSDRGLLLRRPRPSLRRRRGRSSWSSAAAGSAAAARAGRLAGRAVDRTGSRVNVTERHRVLPVGVLRRCRGRPVGGASRGTIGASALTPAVHVASCSSPCWRSRRVAEPWYARCSPWPLVLVPATSPATRTPRLAQRALRRWPRCCRRRRAGRVRLPSRAPRRCSTGSAAARSRASDPRPVRRPPIPRRRLGGLRGSPGVEVTLVGALRRPAPRSTGVSLSAPMGRITGLIGPNGAGKTTTFDACSGLTAATPAAIRVRRPATSPRPPQRRARLGLGRTFQRMELFDTPHRRRQRRPRPRGAVRPGVATLGHVRRPSRASARPTTPPRPMPRAVRHRRPRRAAGRRAVDRPAPPGRARPLPRRRVRPAAARRAVVGPRPRRDRVASATSCSGRRRAGHAASCSSSTTWRW